MASKHILIIDDDPDVREALTPILEPQGYQLTLCSTGQEGRHAATGRVPDLIMLDIMLSTVSEGFHLAYEFRRDEALANVPIIIISSIEAAVGMDYAKELGTDYMPADVFLAKPLEAATVLSTVERALAGAPRAR